MISGNTHLLHPQNQFLEQDCKASPSVVESHSQQSISVTVTCYHTIHSSLQSEMYTNKYGHHINSFNINDIHISAHYK